MCKGLGEFQMRLRNSETCKAKKSNLNCTLEMAHSEDSIPKVNPYANPTSIFTKQNAEFTEFTMQSRTIIRNETECVCSSAWSSSQRRSRCWPSPQEIATEKKLKQRRLKWPEMRGLVSNSKLNSRMWKTPQSSMQEDWAWLSAILGDRWLCFPEMRPLRQSGAHVTFPPGSFF